MILPFMLGATVLAAIGGAFTSEQQNLLNLQQKADKFRLEYEKCKAAKHAKGIPVYGDGSGEGTKCKLEYKKWLDYKVKASEAADAYALNLIKKQGALTAEQAEFLSQFDVSPTVLEQAVVQAKADIALKEAEAARTVQLKGGTSVTFTEGAASGIKAIGAKQLEILKLQNQLKTQEQTFVPSEPEAGPLFIPTWAKVVGGTVVVAGLGYGIYRFTR